MMKMFRKMIAILLAGCTICVLAVGCGSKSKGYSTPEAAAKAYVEALLAEDADMAVKAMYPGVFSSSTHSVSEDDFRSGFLKQAGNYLNKYEEHFNARPNSAMGRISKEELNGNQINNLLGAEDFGKEWKTGDVMEVNIEIKHSVAGDEYSGGAEVVVVKDNNKWYALVLVSLA